MTGGELERKLAAIAAMDGLIGCALVDAETGMAWTSAGGDDMQQICEAASDYWRLYMRHAKHYRSVGELRVQVLIHATGRITIVRCAGSLLLVCVSHEPDRVDWTRWKAMVAGLRGAATLT
jgi:hypothetical protein